MSDEATLAIINGAAGGGRCRARADQAIERLRRSGMRLEVEVTQAPGHATEIARRGYAAGLRHFLSIGGDGTSYEIVNGLFPRDDDEPVTLGICPLGTGNSFLRDFGVRDEDAALSAIERGRTRAVDVIRVRHAGGVLHYINLLTTGFVTDAGDLTNRRFKALGEAGYLVAALVGLVRLQWRVDPIRIDDEEFGDARPAAFLVFSNSQYTGGSFHIAPHADPCDGKLDVIRSVKMGRGAFVKNLVGAYRGKHVDDPRVEERRARKVEFLQPCERLVMLDGEILPLTLHSLEVLPGALQVMA